MLAQDVTHIKISKSLLSLDRLKIQIDNMDDGL